MKKTASLSNPSVREAVRILSIHPTGVAPVPVDYFAGVDEILAPTKKPLSCGSLNIYEPDRLAKLLDRKIQMRLRKQKEIHKIDKELGDIMRLFRSNAGITLSAMAYKTNLPFKHLHDLEQGARSASLLDLVTIFRQYNVQITEAVVRLKKLHGL